MVVHNANNNSSEHVNEQFLIMYYLGDLKTIGFWLEMVMFNNDVEADSYIFMCNKIYLRQVRFTLILCCSYNEMSSWYGSMSVSEQFLCLDNSSTKPNKKETSIMCELQEFCVIFQLELRFFCQFCPLSYSFRLESNLCTSHYVKNQFQSSYWICLTGLLASEGRDSYHWKPNNFECFTNTEPQTSSGWNYRDFHYFQGSNIAIILEMLTLASFVDQRKLHTIRIAVFMDSQPSTSM